MNNDLLRDINHKSYRIIFSLFATALFIQLIIIHYSLFISILLHLVG